MDKPAPTLEEFGRLVQREVVIYEGPQSWDVLVSAYRTLTEELLTGRWQLLNVWGTWCPTCYVEHPYLLELARSGIPIVGLDYKDEDAKARDYLAEYGNPFREVIVDADGQLGLDLGVYGAPETFLINPRGEIVLRHVGEMNQRVWDDKFAPVLQQAGEAPGVAP